MILEMWKRMQRKQEEMEEGRGMAHNQERKEVRANVGYCRFFFASVYRVPPVLGRQAGLIW